MTKDVFFGIVIGACLIGCAGAAYQTYGLDIPDGCYQAGHLLSHDPSGDLSLTVCQPDPEPSPSASPGAVNKMKCRVLRESEFVRMESDLVDCQTRLKDCPQP